LYTSCVLGLRPSALFNEFLLIKKKYIFKNYTTMKKHLN
jgi:hypothetical protein